MIKKTIWFVGIFLVTLMEPLSAQPTDSPVDVKELQEEIRRLKDSNAALTKSNSQLKKSYDELLNRKSAKEAITHPTPTPQSAAAQAPATSVEEVNTEDSTLPGTTVASWLTFEGEEKPWAVNVGTRVWVNSWEGHSLPFTGSGSDSLSGNSISSSSNVPGRISSKGYEATPIPYVNLRYGRFSISANYYASTDFAFNTVTNYITSYKCTNNDFGGFHCDDTGFGSTTINTKAHRSEWDATLGYSLFRNLMFSVGYKRLNLSLVTKEKQAGDCVGNCDVTSSIDYWSLENTNTFEGPMVGLSGAVPIGHGFGLYGSYAHGFMTWTLGNQYLGFKDKDLGRFINAKSGKFNVFSGVDVDYDVIEAGISYTPPGLVVEAASPLTGATLFAGYRMQRLLWDIPFLKGMSDTTQGFTSGLNFAF